MAPKSTNFIDRYMYVVGKSEVPDVFHRWSCYALLAATVEDHCWCEILKNEPLKPNLFVGLVGPGSAGKGVAMNHAVRMYKRAIPSGNTYRGKLTYAHLIDVLGKPKNPEFGSTDTEPHPKLWLIMDELKNGVGGNKQLTEEFVALLTEIYTASNYEVQTGTRTKGDVTITNPCLSWIFGSNQVWLRQVLPKGDLETGFIARACFVLGAPDPKKRYFRPEYPGDRDIVYNSLVERLHELHYGWHGEFEIDPVADDLIIQWYMHRPRPSDDMLDSVWQRQKEFILRFAMIQCMAEGKQMLIEPHHVSEALKMVDEMQANAYDLIEIASESKDTRHINDVLAYVAKSGNIGHSVLLRTMRSKRGYNAEQVNSAIVQGEREGYINVSKKLRGGKHYTWVGDYAVLDGEHFESDNEF